MSKNQQNAFGYKHLQIWEYKFMQLHTANSEILQTISNGEVFGWLSHQENMSVQ